MPRHRKKSRRHAKKRDTSSSSSVSSTSSSSSSDSATSSSSSEHASRKRRKRGRKRSPTVSQNVVLSSVIPEYDPLVDDIDMWLNVVQANASAFGWSDNMVKYQALQKLRNSAKTWLDSLQKNETRWTSWKWRQWRKTLSDTFQTKRCMFNLLKQLVDTKPLPNQSLYEFFFQKKGKIDRLMLRFSERDINSIIVGAIGDSNISTAVEAGNFRYCEDLAAFLHGRTYTATDKPPIQKTHSYTKPAYGNNGSTSHNNDDRSDSAGKTETPSSSRNQLNNQGCYRCGEMGHKRNTCTVKDTIRCTLCSKIGHIEAACKSKLKPKPEKEVEV
ncbi:uncharacterized protein LOC125242216 [Leguminivora glycinivorella]|uniref:uncharacterized protein LOC125242216 n=1 Tax=Leguminivora glycinivorella TaxID=1035111 RepID=UPI00200DBE0B|nr:uncharacterized protein LOC125226453 isoform X1 [Leguminivora glycinivorella]XP_048006904.1 uncharacterized protein LOC125242216 [Leguminivora glycinivorella]